MREIICEKFKVEQKLHFQLSILFRRAAAAAAAMRQSPAGGRMCLDMHTNEVLYLFFLCTQRITATQ